MKFTKLIALLIQYADSIGYGLTFGDAYSKLEFGVHSYNSKHYDRLAVDFNLFIDGKFQTGTEAHIPLGMFWENLNHKCRWGGNFTRPDGNHYEYNIG